MARHSGTEPEASGITDQPDGNHRLSLQTSIDLTGDYRPERLLVDDRWLAVSDGSPESRRQWPLADIEGFRALPSLGSHFIQANVSGCWTDILRRPGHVDSEVTWLIDRLNRTHGPTDSGHQRPATTEPTGGRIGATTDSRPEQIKAQLVSLVRPFIGAISLLLGLSAVAVAIELVPPLLEKMLVDRVLKDAGRPSEHLLLLLAAIVGGLLLVRLSATVVGIWKGYISSRVGTGMTADLRDRLVKKLNDLPLAFHDRNQVGVLMSQVAYDTETLHTLIFHLTSGLLVQSLQLVGISIAMFFLNAKLAAITLLPMPLVLAGSWYFMRYLQPRQHHYWQAVGKQASALMGMLTGIRVVKSFVQENREIRRFYRSSHRLRDSRRTVDFSTSTFSAAMGLLFAIGGLVVWYIGGRDVLFGTMSLGSLMAFIMYLAMFYAPLTSIAEATAWFANFFGTSRRICDVLAVPSESEGTRPTDAIQNVLGRVKLSHVSFGYDKGRPVVKDVSFAVEPGDMIGVVGRSGSGKSTLVSLIARLYEADSGTISIDGVDVRHISLRQLRRQIGMVPQDPFLFRGTIAENIAYGNAQATPEQVMLAAKQADAHDFIMQTPFAYSTQLREGGAGLSGGQRQRLSIGRALLFNPAILILDEATSSVDAESEVAICNTIRRWTRKRTAIVISHRLSTLRGADRLLVFDDGCLVEQGTPEELIALGGIYSKLASIQGSLRDIGRQLGESVGAEALCGVATADEAFGGQQELCPAVSSSGGGGAIAGDSGMDDETHDSMPAIKWLTPQDATISGDPAGALRVRFNGEIYDDCYAVRALPMLYQNEYISIRYRPPAMPESELGMTVSLSHWPQQTREAVNRSLNRRYLMRRIVEISQMHTVENVLALSVITASGPAEIRLETPGEGSQPFGEHGLLLSDAGGNLYVIADRAALPKWQQRLLTLYFGD